MRRILALLIVLLFFFNTAAKAENDFAVSLNSKYEFADNGLCTVSQNFELLNLTTNFYPVSLLLTVPKDAGNIVAFDNIGKIEPQISETEGTESKKKLNLIFNHASTGINKAITLAVSFTTQSYFRSENGAKKIIIPIDKEQLNYLQYEVEIVLPSSMNQPQMIKPQPAKNYFWSLGELKEKEIVIDFSQPSASLKKPPVLDPESKDYRSAFFGIVLGIIIIIAVYLIVTNFHKKK